MDFNLSLKIQALKFCFKVIIISKTACMYLENLFEKVGQR